MSALALQAERIVIQVLQVDVENRLVHAQDKTKAPILVGFTATPSIFSIPQTGELWTAVRYGTQWQLESLLDSDAEAAALADFEPGDTRIVASGTLQTSVQAVAINDLPFGITETDELRGDGSTKTFNLGGQPISSQSVQVFSNGLLIDPRTFTITSNTITFTSAPAVGTLTIVFQRLGTVVYDAATVIGRAVLPFTADDAATVTGVAVVFSPFEGQNFTYIDSGTTIAVGLVSANENAIFTDAATATSQAVITSAEGHFISDSATVTAVAVPSASAKPVTFGRVYQFTSRKGTATRASTTHSGTLRTLTPLKGTASRASTTHTGKIRTSTPLEGTVTRTAITHAGAIAAVAERSGAKVPFNAEYMTSGDPNRVTGVAAPSATDTADFVDASTATGTAVASASIVFASLDAATVIGVAAISTSSTYGDGNYGSGTYGTAVPNDTAQFVDAGTATGHAALSATDISTFIDTAGTAVGHAVVSAIDTAQYVESATVAAHAVVSAAEGAQFADTNTVTGHAVISSVDTAQFADTGGTASGHAVPSATDTAQYIEVGTATGIAIVGALIDGFAIDAGTVIGVAVIPFDYGLYGSSTYGSGTYGFPAHEWRTSDDSATVTGVAVVFSTATTSEGFYGDIQSIAPAKGQATRLSTTHTGDIQTVTPLKGAVTRATTTHAGRIETVVPTEGTATRAATTHVGEIETVAPLEGALIPTGGEIYIPVDPATVTGHAVVSATDTAQYTDASTASGHAVASATLTQGYTDAGTAVGHAVPSASEGKVVNIWEPLVLGLPIQSVYTIALNSEDIETS